MLRAHCGIIADETAAKNRRIGKGFGHIQWNALWLTVEVDLCNASRRFLCITKTYLPVTLEWNGRNLERDVEVAEDIHLVTFIRIVVIVRTSVYEVTIDADVLQIAIGEVIVTAILSRLVIIRILHLRVGTTSNSCSTMHTLHKRDLTLDDFSHEHLSARNLELLQRLIDEINLNRVLYVKGFKGTLGNDNFDVEPNNKDYWWQMIQLLPSSFNQLRTIDLNYENLYSMYFQRRNHKLDEWHTFCDWIESLPYMREFIEAVEG